MRTVIMVGAGASCDGPGIFYTPDGGVTREEKHPPLGNQLLVELTNAYPEMWGAAAHDFFSTPPLDFEKGMGAMYQSLWLSESEVQKARFINCLVLMSEYFSRWDCYQDTLYARLIRQLVDSGLLSTSGSNPDTAFVSLNYERLLEWAVFDAGLFVLHHARESSEHPNSVPVWKPHGSSNFVVSAREGTGHYPTKDDLDGGFRPMRREPLADLIRRMKDALSTGEAHDPLIAMSLYMDGKLTLTGKEAIDTIRRSYDEDILAADLLIMIGVRPSLTDRHLFDSIKAGPKKIIHVGRLENAWEMNEFNEFVAACTGSVEHVASTFKEALENQVFHR